MNNNRATTRPKSADSCASCSTSTGSRRPAPSSPRRRGELDLGTVNVLAVIHGTNARGGVFRDVVEEAGHRYDEWSLAWGTPSPQPLERYDAVIVFGGSMHADQEEHHPG